MTDGPVRAGEIESRRVSWLWRDLIPRGMLTVVAGKPDQGKGLFSAHVAADISKRGGKVLYSAIEDDHGLMTRPRLEAAGAKLENVLLWRFQLPMNQNELRALVLKHKIDLIVMDPFNAHLSGGVNRFGDKIRQVTSPLSQLAEEANCGVLIIEHALKRVSPNAHPLAAIGGSGSGLVAAARMAFLFGQNPKDADQRVLSCVKHNIREDSPSLMFELDVEELPTVGDTAYLVYSRTDEDFDPRDLLQVTKGVTGRPPDKRAAAAEWLTNYLASAGEPVKAGDILEDAKQYGMSSKTIRRAADDMKVVKDPPGGGKGCTWELSNEVKKIMGLPYDETVEEEVDDGEE